MNVSEWMLFVIRAVDRDRFRGDESHLRLVAEMICEHSQTQDILRAKGYLPGGSLPDAAERVPNAN